MYASAVVIQRTTIQNSLKLFLSTLMSESYILRHEQCPECKKKGRDNGRDNLGIYSDGHEYCYSCGYFVAGSIVKRYQAKTSEPVVSTTKQVVLPYDVSTILPHEATTWLTKYGFDANTITRNLLMWSPSREMLIFPYFIEGDLLGWQGRLFGEEKVKRKWFTQGAVDDILYVVGPPGKTLTLVESIVSAIKVGRMGATSPLFGSHVSNNRLLRIAHFYDTINLWLDPDKRTEAVNIAKRAQLFGLKTRVILSEKKPKDHTTEEIESICR